MNDLTFRVHQKTLPPQNPMEEAILRDQIARMNASGLYDIEVPKVKPAAWLKEEISPSTAGREKSLPAELIPDPKAVEKLARHVPGPYTIKKIEPSKTEWHKENGYINTANRIRWWERGSSNIFPNKDPVSIENLSIDALADFIIREKPAVADRIYTIKVEDAAALTTSEASPQLSPAFQESAAGPVPTPCVVPPELEGITPSQMEAWHAVNAARSRANRANLTSEQAAHQSREGTRRSAASRERMSPEKRAARSAREADRIREKRAQAKNLQP